MSERTNRGLDGSRENFMKFFGEEEVVGVDKPSKRLSGIVSRLFRGHRTVMVGDVFVLIFATGNERRVEEGSGCRVRGEHAVHLRMLSQLCRREGRAARGSSLGYVGVDRVAVSRSCWCGIIGYGVEVDHIISGDHVVLLWGDIFRGSSFEVLGFLVPF